MEAQVLLYLALAAGGAIAVILATRLWRAVRQIRNSARLLRRIEPNQTSSTPSDPRDAAK